MGAAPAAGSGQAVSADEIIAEIKREIGEHKILVYGKGTKDQPMCGFTIETKQFFEQLGYPFEILNVLDNPAKRQVLTQMTDWPTLPKVFINGEFYGDTDILGPMQEKGELTALLAEAFK
ncbi:MAG: glutaredoxin [Candidatus Sericytochromatia bacterium]|uniref:Glutaredoxin n=1 Tax=Candidatus Tanganyikabacteria bacterium TaxID=2961651 RepID=A0A938BMD1_9BACT|nr:glutaredoxin [Candidatus Tanganyikabacteria bacterium]